LKVVATNKSIKERIKKKGNIMAKTFVTLFFENDINKVIIRYIAIGMNGKKISPNPFNISFE
jgi:hypothetical protein